MRLFLLTAMGWWLGSLSIFGASTPQSIGSLREVEREVKATLPKISPSVVAVQIGDSVGSGVVVSAEGLVLSVAHVGERPNRDVRFTFPDGKTARGKTLGTNHELDAGMMKITDSGSWPHVEMAPSGSSTPGDWVLTLGHPGGWDPDRPLVVRLGRVIRVGVQSIQTDCTITAGDSGGPLFDLQGRVVALHSYVRTSTTENYHVPIQAYRDSWDRLLKGESWGKEEPSPRPWLGTRGVDDPEGCLLERVDENGPASKAGLKEGDLVLKINDKVVDGSDSYRRMVGESKIGSELKLTVKRESVERIVTVKVGERKRR